MIKRVVSIRNNYSFFLFGPRGSGKSTLLRDIFSKKPNIVWIDLLDPEEESVFQTEPQELMRRTSNLSPGGWVVIDEVQKAPKLLDLVHKLIEEKNLFFALSGSSARKLKRGGANLLAGRAFVYYLYPFTFDELGSHFDLSQTLAWGSLPKTVEFGEDENRKNFLRAYANTYLKEEIQVEQLVRNLPGFRKFLEVAAQMNGQPLNYSGIAKEVRTDHSVIKNYFDILEDTLIGFRLEAYGKSIRKQQRLSPKFYFIDCGIKRALEKTLDIPVRKKTYEYGRLFEHFFVTECFKRCQYRQKDEALSYLRTKDDVEVDLIIQRPGQSEIFVEIKSATQLIDADFRRLSDIGAGLKNRELFLVSQDPHPKSKGDIKALPWQDFLERFLSVRI